MSDKPIEVEIRTFLTKEQYSKLIHFFTTHGQFLNEDEQVTYYFESPPTNSPQDLRIQKNKFYSKVWLEMMAAEEEQEEVLRLLKEKLAQLGVPETPKGEFEQKYQYYKENWRALI